MNAMRTATVALILAGAAMQPTAGAEPPVANVVFSGAIGEGILKLSHSHLSDADWGRSLLAGAVLESDQGIRCLLLRDIVVPAEAVFTAELPVALLQVPSGAPVPQVWRIASPPDPALVPLLAIITRLDDLPKETAQLAILMAINDVDLASWRRFRHEATAYTPTVQGGAEVVVALDALSILRKAWPQRRWRLEAEGELRLRALRDPHTRAAAEVLFGVAPLADAPAAPIVPATPPQIDQLLHRRPGANCPVCRMRSRSEADVP